MKMKQHMDNVKHNIYPQVNKYLTGNTDVNEHRFLKTETLTKFRVGVSEDKFFDDV